MLRAIQLGLSVADLDLITFGQLMDLIVESDYDESGYVRQANQADFDNF